MQYISYQNRAYNAIRESDLSAQAINTDRYTLQKERNFAINIASTYVVTYRIVTRNLFQLSDTRDTSYAGYVNSKRFSPWINDEKHGGNFSVSLLQFVLAPLQFVLDHHETSRLSIANLQRDRPLPVASVCVGEHHVCVESPEHVSKTIAFNGGILNTDRRTVVLHSRYDYDSVTICSAFANATGGVPHDVEISYCKV